MLGHPGISAFEYAGTVERHLHEEKAWEKATEQRAVKRATGHVPTPSADFERAEDASQPVASTETSESQQPQTPIDEYTIAQRRRGTFMNHTPRNHEVRLSTRLSHQQTSTEDFERLYASCRGSSDDNTNTSVSYSGHHSSYGSFAADQSIKLSGNTPVELDSTELPLNPLIMHPLPTVPAILPRQRHSRSSSAGASIKSSQTSISKRSLRTFLGRNASLDASFRHQPASFDELRPSTPGNKSKLRPETANSKRRRRQTPYKIPQPLVTDLGRHAPLEPLVLHHRREVTGSDVDPLPPHVDIGNDISEAATLLAINEYFDSQEAALAVHQPIEIATQAQSSSPEKPLDQEQQHSSSHRSSKSKEDTAPTENHEEPEESTPSLPERNPERLSRINSPLTPQRTKSVSEMSIQSDFTSAAKGQYSPYDERYDIIPKMLRRVPVPTSPRVQSQEEHTRSISSASGKLAPRIPGHEELASSRLNDFNYFLRMTGPPPPTEAKAVPKKKPKGLKVMKVRSKKEAKNGMTHPGSGVQQEKPHIPACAREMTTSFGAKHLRIMIPGEEDTGTAPETVHITSSPTLELDAQTHHPHRASVAWTEEMLHPLASSPVERAIHPADPPATRAPRSPLRSPKPAAVSPKAVPVEDHPLLVSRKEQTRNRKLRDLQKARGKVDGAKERSWEDRGEKVRRLEGLVAELAEGLKAAAGIEEGLGPEEVLEAWRGMGTERRVGTV